MSRGRWIQTYTGRAFYPLDPRPEDIDPLDIGHALGMICRYGGHVDRFYSVAEHCVLLSHAVTPANALWALLHDATEAYVGDVVRPLKLSACMDGYRTVENRLSAVIADHFSLPAGCPAEVKEADTRILLDERFTLLHTPPRRWAPELEALDPLGVHIAGWDPVTAEAQWLTRLAELHPETP